MAVESEAVNLQDVVDRLAELTSALETVTRQQDERLNDLIELVQEIEAKIDELQESFDELGTSMDYTDS